MEMRSRAFDRVGTFLWNLRPKRNDEKIPFAHNSARKSSGAIFQALAVPGSGQIAKEMAMDSKKNYQEDSGTPPLMLEEDKGPMSKSRKACFLLSFNSWILYVAAIFWFVPCSFNNLPGSLKWDKTFSNMELTTELEKTGHLLIFGCNSTRANGISQRWGTLIALDSTNGDIVWTKSLHFIPFQVYCRNSASTETSVCTVIGEKEIVLVDSLNGNQLWNQTLGSDFVNQENSSIILCDSSKIPMAIKRNVLIDKVANQYKILNIDTSKQIIGLESINFPIDCDELLLKSDSIILDNNNEENMVFICRHPQSIDLWAVPEKVLCEGENEENGTIGEKVHHIYRINSDRVPLPDGILIADVKKHGLVVGWSNVVTLLSKATPHPQIWKHLFKSSSVVVSIIPGRFTSIKEDEIAVSIQDDSRGSVVHVLSLLDGKVVVSMPVGHRQIRSVSLIPGQQLAGTDRLLIQMGTNNFTAMLLPSQSGEMSKFIGKDRLDESNSFYEVNLRKQELTSRLVTTSSPLYTKVITNQEGDVNLVVTEQEPDVKLTIRDVVLKSNLQSGCSLA